MNVEEHTVLQPPGGHLTSRPVSAAMLGTRTRPWGTPDGISPCTRHRSQPLPVRIRSSMGTARLLHYIYTNSDYAKAIILFITGTISTIQYRLVFTQVNCNCFTTFCWELYKDMDARRVKDVEDLSNSQVSINCISLQAVPLVAIWFTAFAIQNEHLPTMTVTLVQH